MNTTKKWNNWLVFLMSIIAALIIAYFMTPYYLDSPLFTGGFLAMESIDLVESFFGSFLFLYTLFLSFFYKAFAKSYKPLHLIYFLVLPFLLFVSSTKHLLIFGVLAVVGLLLGYFVRKT